MSNTQHQNSGTTKLVLALKSKQRADQELALSRKKSTLGSHKDCTVVLNSDQIQPMHCMVIQGQRGTIVRNFHADTRINGESFGDAWLSEGDAISIGNVDLLNRVDISKKRLAEATNQMVDDQGSPSCQVEPHQSEATFELIERLTKMEGVLDHLHELNETNRSRTRRVIKSLRDKSRASDHQLSKNREEVNQLEAANMALLNEIELLRKESVTKGELQRLTDTINQNSDHIDELVSCKDATIIKFAEKNSVLAAELDSIRSQMENAPTPCTDLISRPKNDVALVIDQLKLEQKTSDPNDAPQPSVASVDANAPLLSQSSSNVSAAKEDFDFGQNDEVNVDPNHPHFENADNHSLDVSAHESEFLNLDSMKTSAFSTENSDEAESTSEKFGTAFNGDTISPEAFVTESESTDSAAREENSGDVETSETNHIGLEEFDSKFDVPSESTNQETDNADERPTVDPFAVLATLDNARSEFEVPVATGEFSELDEQGNATTDLSTKDNTCDENSLTDHLPENGICNDGITEPETVTEDTAESLPPLSDLVEPTTDGFDAKLEADAFDRQFTETQEVPKPEILETESPQRDEPKDQLDNTTQFEDSHAENRNSLCREESQMESVDIASLQSRLDDFVGKQLGTDQSNEESNDVDHELVPQPEPSFDTSDFLREFEKMDDQVSQEVTQETSLEVESCDAETAFGPATPESSKINDDTSGEIEFNFGLAESNLTGAFADFQKGSEDNDDESTFVNATELHYSEEELSSNDDAQTETSSDLELSAAESEPSNDNETAVDANPYAAFLNEQLNEPSATSNECNDFSETSEPESKSDANAESETGLSTAHLFEQLNQFQESESTSPPSGECFDNVLPAQEDRNDSEPAEDQRLATQPGNTSSKSDEMNSEESYIHDYMQRLLGNSEVKQDETAPSETSDAPSLLEQTFEEEIRERQEMLKPSEFVPKASAPERKSNLQAMRELANQSAKSALAVSSQKRKFEQQSTLVLIGSGVCFFLGAISAMFITQAICVPTLFSVIFFSLTGFGVSYFYDLKNPRKPVKQATEQTSTNGLQTKESAALPDVSQPKTSSHTNQNTEPVSDTSKPGEGTTE